MNLQQQQQQFHHLGNFPEQAGLSLNLGAPVQNPLRGRVLAAPGLFSLARTKALGFLACESPGESAMAPGRCERLFSLELVVDWVRLESGLPPPEVAVEAEREAEAAPPQSSSRPLRPAVAFRLLDFPTLLVYPPGGPTARAPEPQPGLFSFGRGKSCLFRWHPATLRRLLLGTPLYTMLLHLPPGHPTPAPQLLGACSISLGNLVHRVLARTSSSCTQGHRGSFSLHNEVGELIGDIALAYRLADLGSTLLGHLERPVTSVAVGVEAVELQKAPEVSSESQRGKQAASDSNSLDAGKPLVALKPPKKLKDLKAVVVQSEANSASTGSVENGVASAASSPNQDIRELDTETNIFCPPPLYYTHLPPPKMPPLQHKITIKPQVSLPEEFDGASVEERPANPPTHSSHLKHTNCTAQRTTPMLINPPPHVQDVGGSSQTSYLPQSEQDRINMISQLPLLNALLVELSVLYNQPMASPTRIHPHLSWLYRSENKKSPESYAKPTFDSARKDKLSTDGNEKAVSPQYKENQVANLKKGRYFRNSGIVPNRVPRGKLLYGLTNTLKLRLKQTNPAMLVVHEKREQYRKMQAQMLGAKLGITSSKIKVVNFAKHQQEHQMPKDQHLESVASFSEIQEFSEQTSGAFDNPGSTTETKLNCATEKTVDGESSTKSGALEGRKNQSNPTVPGRLIHTNSLGGKVEMKVQNTLVYQQFEDVSRIVVVDKEIDDREIKITESDFLTADKCEDKPCKNSCSESISELNYSDDFTSSCYFEESDTNEATSRILPTCNSSPRAGASKHSQYTHKSRETRLSTRETSSEKSSFLSPPFSIGSPVHSQKRSPIVMKLDRSLEESSSTSINDFSSLHWTEKKGNSISQNSVLGCKITKMDKDISVKLETRTDCKSLEKSQSLQTSQVSSYISSNLTELKDNDLDSSVSENFEEDDVEIGSLNISKQCKDISDLVVNKLPGYTV
ncbi:microtubule-associated protein 10 [Erinaceus europaeus]|uniref:Microtubule-associated protein 10 n=1 Tax=Erinaceus europaeus TaxID=9365 RepID=A0A1S3AKB7_ERIEU|nr:microtubule-associated protein 10 [Erinaceus europaeus]